MEENLVLTNYGVTLRRLTHDQIEMLRQWRNDPKIQKYMFFRQEITPQMQEQWFASLDPHTNFYFIIEYEGEAIGLINVKNVDYEKRNGESGVFIYEDKYLNTDIAYRAHLLMFDYIYEELKLERARDAQDEYYKFITEYPDSKPRKEADKMFVQINKITKE